MDNSTLHSSYCLTSQSDESVRRNEVMNSPFWQPCLSFFKWKILMQFDVLSTNEMAQSHSLNCTSHSRWIQREIPSIEMVWVQKKISVTSHTKIKDSPRLGLSGLSFRFLISRTLSPNDYRSHGMKGRIVNTLAVIFAFGSPSYNKINRQTSMNPAAILPVTGTINWKEILIELTTFLDTN